MSESDKETWQAEGKGSENNCDYQLRLTYFFKFFTHVVVFLGAWVLVIPFVQAVSLKLQTPF